LHAHSLVETDHLYGRVGVGPRVSRREKRGKPDISEDYRTHWVRYSGGRSVGQLDYLFLSPALAAATAGQMPAIERRLTSARRSIWLYKVVAVEVLLCDAGVHDPVTASRVATPRDDRRDWRSAAWYGTHPYYFGR
jgi:hypothetical protein